MKKKRVRVRVPASPDYTGAADLLSHDGETVQVTNISGMPSSLVMTLPANRVSGRQRSGRRGRRRKEFK